MVEVGDKVYELFGRPPVNTPTGHVVEGERQSFGLYTTEAAANGKGQHLMSHEFILSWTVDERSLRGGQPPSQ